jgi:GNAT superfamily N-acetyltransferase
MLRLAVAADVPALLAIRDRSGADALSDPTRADEGLLRRLIDSGTVVVWDDAGIAGFAATDGAAIHLLVDIARRGGGIGRALLNWACDTVRNGGYVAAIVRLAPGSTAERHYRTAGWTEAGGDAVSGLLLQKPS